jgi:valyl-tRNA synthetase
LCTATYPKATAANPALLQQADLAFSIITNIRDIRAKANLKNSELVDVFYSWHVDDISFEAFLPKIKKLARVENLSVSTEDKAGLKSFLAKNYKFFVATGEVADDAAELEKLQKELEYAQGFLNSVEKKLSNEKFVNSAPPQVLENEQKKKQDALQKDRQHQPIYSANQRPLKIGFWKLRGGV